LAAPLMLIAPWASAGDDHDHEHRQQEAHVHGIAALNLALEGNQVQLELDSPAANVVGFEHVPSSDEDQAAMDKAVARLENGDALFRFNDEAGCRMQAATVTSELIEDEHAGAHDQDAHDHADEEAGDHDEHGHDGEPHADILAAYHFECDSPNQLARLTVGLFEAFTGMEEIKVQYVIENKQGAAELTAQDQVVKF
jgi:hypothetical protein